MLLVQTTIMKCPTYFVTLAIFASSFIGNVLGKPLPQVASRSSTLLEFEAAPAPASPIGGPGDFVSIDSATKLFKIGGKVKKFVGMHSKWLISMTRAYPSIGTNTWWLAYTKDNADIDRVLADIAKASLPPCPFTLPRKLTASQSGLPVTRAWGFGETHDASSANNNFFQELKGGKQLLNFDPATGISNPLRQPRILD